MSSSSDSSASASAISESETMNSSSEIVGVSSSLQLETVLDDSFSEGDWETGFIFLSGDNFLENDFGRINVRQRERFFVETKGNKS